MTPEDRASYRRIDKLRKQFMQLQRHERHLAHRHLLDVRRRSLDKTLTDNTTHVGCRVTRSDKRLLADIAEAKGTTTSGIVRDVVHDYLETERAKWGLPKAS
jgi:hypothetical protein